VHGLLEAVDNLRGALVTAHSPGRAPGIADSVADLVGNTPLVRLNRVAEGLAAQEVVRRARAHGRVGANERAQQIGDRTPDAWMPQQFRSASSPEAHARTTAEGIWRDTDGEIDIFVAAVGSGGTITGTARALKDRKPSLQFVGAEPVGNPVITSGRAGPHRIEGIGANFVPQVFERDLVGEILLVDDTMAEETARRLAADEGLLVGASAGANVWVALQVAARPENEGKLVVTVLCDGGDRYLTHPLFAGLDV